MGLFNIYSLGQPSFRIGASLILEKNFWILGSHDSSWNSKTSSDLKAHFLELPFDKVRPRRGYLTLGVWLRVKQRSWTSKNGVFCQDQYCVKGDLC